MHTSTVTQKGQVVIPAPLRRKLGFETGTKVIITETADGIRIRPVHRDYFEQFAGLLPGKGAAVHALLDERTNDRAHEDRHS